MHEELIKAANELKAAADALIEVASRPDPVMDKDGLLALLASEEVRDQMRELIHTWFEHDVERRLTELEDSFSGFEEKLDEKVDERVPDMSGWDNLDPGDVEEAMNDIQAMPDHREIEAVTEVFDAEEYGRAVEMAPKVEQLLKALGPFIRALDEVKELVQAA